LWSSGLCTQPQCWPTLSASHRQRCGTRRSSLSNSLPFPNLHGHATYLPLNNFNVIPNDLKVCNLQILYLKLEIIREGSICPQDERVRISAQVSADAAGAISYGRNQLPGIYVAECARYKL